MRFPRQITAFCGIIALAFLPACDNNDIRTYRVAKSSETQSQASANAPNPHDAHGHAPSVPSLKWTTPKGWEELPPGEMRAASFRIKGQGDDTADLGVFPLPGMAGSDLSNVNRWRSQVGLEPITEQDLASITEKVDISGTTGQLYDLLGSRPGEDTRTRILAAILRRDGMAWFFKMTGEDILVASQKDAFKQFLKSIAFVDDNDHAARAADLSAPAPGTPPPPQPGPGAAADPAPNPGRKPQWTIPQTWKEAPAGQFLAAKYLITGDNGAEAAVNISVSAGDGGGVLGNLNRWRGQLGLQPANQDQLNLQTIQTASGHATLADLKGTDPRTSKPAQIIGAIVSQNGQTWFYKLMGDQALTQREKDAFIQLISTAKY